MSTLAYVSPWILHGVMLARNGVFRMDTIRRIRRRVFRLLSGVDKNSVEYGARIWGLLSEDEGYEDNKILPVDHTNQGMNPISSASPYHPRLIIILWHTSPWQVITLIACFKPDCLVNLICPFFFFFFFSWTHVRVTISGVWGSFDFGRVLVQSNVPLYGVVIRDWFLKLLGKYLMQYAVIYVTCDDNHLTIVGNLAIWHHWLSSNINASYMPGILILPADWSIFQQ